MDQKEKRHFIRVIFHSPITLVGKESTWCCNLIDISLKGALTEIPDNWDGSVGDHLGLEIPLNEESVVIKMDATISHIEDHRIGFMCDHIDIDSISHLRRLMELNTGDPDLVNRELGELGRMDG